MNRDTTDGDGLPADDARERLFDEILEQLARCDLFSNTALGDPTIFPVYAHDNDAAGVGTAHASCVHDLIRWFQRIKAGILSDKSALPPLTSDLEDTSAQRNIIANQIRLLPLRGHASAEKAVACIDKVLVCGSAVLEKYCETPYASQYIDNMVNICIGLDNLSMEELKTQIEDFVHSETGKDEFHHVLTEVAFLRVRKSRRPGRHGMVPVALNEAHHLPYLAVFGDSDITFKLKSPSAADRHALFFKLLEQLFVQHKALAHDFKNCYDKVVEDLKLPLDGKTNVSRNHFHNCLNSNMTKMYRKHWSAFSTAMKNGKFNEYAGILGKHVLDILDQNKVKERRKILQWVSPMAAPPMPGKYEDGHAKRVDGTCEWVIEDEKFIEWYKSETSAIKSLQGRMGTGKTYATSRVIEWIQRSLVDSQHHKALAHFYCVEQDGMRNTATAIIRNIVRQIAAGPRDDNPLDEAIVNMWKKHGHNSQGRDTTTLGEWEDYLSKLITTFYGVTIVVDALDECKSAQRTDLTKVFTFLVERCSNLKIFVSTRPESDLSRWLEQQPSISMHSGGTSKDIAAFVRDKIAQHSEWPDLDGDLQERMVKTVVDKSQGLFLCAHLQIENLNECLFEEDILDELERLPQELTQLYEKLYLHATAKSAAKKYTDRALRWVLCSLKPLTSDELLYAISQDAHTDRLSPTRRELTESLILKSCHNFLALDSNNTEQESRGSRKMDPPAPVWRLAHQAVAEFFHKSARCSEERAEMHYEAGKVCLMITLNTFGGPAVEDEMMNGYICPCGNIRVSAEDQYHFELQQPLGEYAVHAWPTHMRSNEHQESRNSGGLSQLLLRFLNGSGNGYLIYPRWLQHASSNAFYRPWSAIYQRRMPSFKSRMSPLILACYLGFPQTLSELLSPAGPESDMFYDSEEWSPWEQTPWYRYFNCLGPRPLRWSAVALACAHDEVKVVQRLLDSEPPPRLDTIHHREVPPIVVAALVDSVKVAGELLQPHRGLPLSSSFTGRHGHVLRFAIMSNSMQVLPMLLDRVLADSPTLEEPLSSVRLKDFRSTKATKAISLLLQKGVEVNTPLRDGTLLAAAADLGEEGLVAELLGKGADANTQFQCLPESQYQETIENALEACLDEWERHKNSASVARLLVESGAAVSVRAVRLAACKWGLESEAQQQEREPDLMRLLVTRMPDPNDTIQHVIGGRTCALQETLRYGSLAAVESLLDRGADPNLSVESRGARHWAFSTVFGVTVRTALEYPYPTRQIVELLEKAGADLGSLERQDLNIALAATAWAGMTNLVTSFLQRGADPNALVGYDVTNAFCAAAASPQPGAPNIVRMLLDKADVNLRFSHRRYNIHADLALDLPLWLILDEHGRSLSNGHGLGHVECLGNWAQSASVLASNGAVWDVDFAQWRECLRLVEPAFESQEAETLDTIQENLERNWNRLNASQKESDEWRIKDPLATEYDRQKYKPRPREVLSTMNNILRKD